LKVVIDYGLGEPSQNFGLLCMHYIASFYLYIPQVIFPVFIISVWIEARRCCKYLAGSYPKIETWNGYFF